ncbi:hypothetical protein [Kutzneria sp. NPDC051319]|uniref:hypothetical protein n=1 Tax=Kutzneria sp. NPDC051319 TaxID=3155047 RepID=UPI00343FCE00
MPEKYKAAEQATLFALMLARRPVGNPDLRKDYKIELPKPGRDRLNKDGLIRTWTVKRRLVHQITDDGITWCVKELGVVEAPDRSGPLPRMVFEVMRSLPQYLKWRDIDFVDVINRGSLEAVIREAHQDLLEPAQDWVRLARLRPRLDDVDRSEVDDLFLKMIKTGLVHFAPDSNTKALTEVDHAAAIRVGGEDKHLMAIEEL